MESIPKDKILDFRKDTLQSIRKEYELDSPGRMDQAIDVLLQWVKKQNHFIKKDFRRDYLERRIIQCKGSVERAKKSLDGSCTMKTLMPNYFQFLDVKNDYPEWNVIQDALLPKLTDDYYRVYLLRNIGKRFENGFINYFRFQIMLLEYTLARDYCKGIVVIYDFTDINIMEFLKTLDLVELRQLAGIIMEGYSLRLKGIHIVTTSKLIDSFVVMLKQIFSPKIGNRIKVHKNYESLCKDIQSDILPVELGGKERSIEKLHEEWIDVLNSKEFEEYFQGMIEARTDEACRRTDKFNEEYMGTPGTFRTFNVD